MPQNEASGSRCVLVVRFSAMGDVAMAIGPLYDACRSNPGVRFVFLTKAPTAKLLLDSPANLTVVGADMKTEYSGTGIKVSRIRKGRREKARLVGDGSDSPAPIASTDSRYRRVFEGLGLKLSGRPARFFAGGADPSAFAEITPPKAPGECWIGIAPFAAHRAKIYPPERMREVVERLSEDPSVRIFLFGGGEEEKRILGQWAEELPRVTNVAERRYGFAVEMALMSRLDAMVAMDSGNMHLAALAGVPTVTIWGATHPSMGFTPQGFDPSLAVQTPMECRPCSVFGNRPCRRGDYRCLDSIEPADILSRIKSIIQ